MEMKQAKRKYVDTDSLDSMTDDPVRIFKEENDKLEKLIKEKTKQKSRLSAVIRDTSVKVDTLRKNIKYLQNQQIQRENELKDRKNKLDSSSNEYEKANEAYITAQKKNERLKTVIEKIKNELQKAKILIENEESKLREIRPSVIDYRLLETNIEYFKQRIESKKVMLRQKNADYETAKQTLKDLQRDEQKLSDMKISLEESIEDLDARRLQTQQILTEPIDNLSYEEEIVADAENDVKEIESRHNVIQNEKIQLSPEIVDEISSLEQENAIRREGLETRQKQLEALKTEYQNNPVKSQSKVSKNSAAEPSTPQKFSIASAQELMDNISQQLNEKLKKVDEAEQATDDIERENLAKRKEVEESWTKKTEQMKALIQQKNVLDSLQMQIGELSTQNDHLSEDSVRNHNRIDELNHRNSNAQRDKNKNTTFAQALQKLRDSLKEKEKENQQMDETLQNMREMNKQLEQECQKLEESMKSQEERTLTLEDEAKQMDANVRAATERSNEQKRLLDEFIAAHPYIQQDPNDMMNQLTRIVQTAQ